MIGLSFLQLCEAGKFQSGRGNEHCDPCPKGRYCPLGASSATPCGGGTIRVRLGAASQDDCEPSFVGTYSANGLPVNCPIGYYRSIVGAALADDCFKCPAYSTTDTTGIVNDTQCICQRGFVPGINAAGMQECQCEPGEGLVTTLGVEACVPCAIGNYKPTRGNVACNSCPSVGWTTAGLGSVERSSCICDKDYFMAPVLGNDTAKSDEVLFDCYHCDTVKEKLGQDSTNCSLEIGQTLEKLPINPGFFRDTNISRIVRLCPNPAACLGGSHTPTQCVMSQHGPFCGVCKPNYISGSADAICALCEGGDIELTPQISIAITFSLPILGILLLFFLCRRFGQYHRRLMMENMPNAIHLGMDEDPEDLWKVAMEKAEEKLAKERPILFGRLRRITQNAKAFGVRFKILISLMQVLKGVGMVFTIRFPPIFKGLLGWIGTITLVDLDLPKLTPMGCLFPVNYFTSMLTKTAGPLAIVGLFKLVTVIANRFCAGKKKDDWDTDKDGIVDREEYFAAQSKGQLIAATADTISFYVLFIVYPSASVTVLQFFGCSTFDQPGETNLKYLLVDFGVDCEGEEYQAHSLYVFAMIIIYPLGVCPDGV